MLGWHYQGNPDYCFDGQTYRVWLILRYPKSEFAKLADLVVRPEKLLSEILEHMEAKDWQQALQGAKVMIREYPLGTQQLFQTERALLLAAECQEKLGKIEEAKQEFEKILNLSADHGSRQTARIGYNRTRDQLAGSVSGRRQELNTQAVTSLLSRKEYSAALTMAQRLINQEGATVETVDLAARALLGLGDLEQALALYDSIIDSASPARFRLLRNQIQTAQGKLAAQRIGIGVGDLPSMSWTMLLPSELLVNRELQTYIRSLQNGLLQLLTKHSFQDWQMLSDVLMADTNSALSRALAAPEKLWTAAESAGAGTVDLVIVFSLAPPQEASRQQIAVDLLWSGKPATHLFTDSVLIKQPKLDNVASIAAGRNALQAGEFLKAGRIYQEIGQSEYGALLGTIADIQETTGKIIDQGKVSEEQYTNLMSSFAEIRKSRVLWLESSKKDEKPDTLAFAKSGLAKAISRLEAHFQNIGGDTRMLIALLNNCREIDLVLEKTPIEERFPAAIKQYQRFAEKYRATPAWAIADSPWIDASTGFPAAVRDKAFEYRFMYINGGSSFFGDPTGQKQATVSGFFLQEHETTNANFLRFCENTGWQRPTHLVRREDGFSEDDQPVTRVSYLDARNYAKWFSRQLAASPGIRKWQARLPTELEWERAARLDFPLRYHHGALPSSSRRGTPAPVSLLTGDRAPSGVRGLAANVSEWCLDGWVTDYTASIHPGQTDVVNGNSWEQRKVVKGAAYFAGNKDDLLISTRQATEADNREPWLGFRLAIVRKGEKTQ